ncbi:serine/threonine-protein kinase [Aquipuribacter nitratireducens]|uniref:non-specific serine/threonine protein kinase n=1 Tax=Aquipuribacter nitratireducens TaxID=650104 RepID=A0ABW0GJW5_9MICO
MSAAPEPCREPGCTGDVVDGYCDVCGVPGPTRAGAFEAAVASAATALGGAGSATVPSDPSSADLTVATPGAGASTSMRLASAALGTALGTARGSETVLTPRRAGSSSTRLRAARLGAGLTRVPPLPAVDAEKALMRDPVLAESKRFCPSCGSPVGRSVEGRPGRTEGFCPQCRSPFSFSPKLRAGDLVAGQYEVAGPLAHGGLGWIYLARDRNVSDRWVVLKGLLNSQDADALGAALAERQFLARVEHPLIVEIYNFVSHDGSGYIVMEYVGGTSLKALLKDRMRRAGHYDPLPLDQAIAYVLEVLPAFGYLHDLGLLYCDFKPDNIIQVGDEVRLIDLGGVRRADDHESVIYGTVGYQAPEVPSAGPSVASDIYTLGRALVVMSTEFRGYQTTYATSLPPLSATPLFQRYESFYRLVVKACAPEPADRFASAAEMRVQLLGVLREVVAQQQQEAAGSAGPAGPVVHAAPSLHFEVPRVAGDTLEWSDLPGLLPDPSDPQAGWLATVSVDGPAERLEALLAAPSSSPEVLVQTGIAALHAGHADEVETAARELLRLDPWDWRAVWLQGLAALAADDGRAARGAFNAVYGQVPGELAPKLALALACERSGEPEIAEGLYAVCARTDAAYTPPAAFGLARIRGARGATDDAVAALELVPSTSRAYVDARAMRASLLAGPGAGLPSLAAAVSGVEGVAMDPRDRTRLTVTVLRAALEQVRTSGPQPALLVAGHAATERSLRDGLESAIRDLATTSDSPAERVRLVDEANRVRRWTWL